MLPPPPPPSSPFSANPTIRSLQSKPLSVSELLESTQSDYKIDSLDLVFGQYIWRSFFISLEVLVQWVLLNPYRPVVDVESLRICSMRSNSLFYFRFLFYDVDFFCPHFGCAFLLILEFEVLQLILTRKMKRNKVFQNADQIRDKFTLRFTSVFPYIFVEFNTIILDLFARWHLVWFLICWCALFFLASIYMDYFGLSFIPTSKIFCTSIYVYFCCFFTGPRLVSQVPTMQK